MSKDKSNAQHYARLYLDHFLERWPAVDVLNLHVRSNLLSELQIISDIIDITKFTDKSSTSLDDISKFVSDHWFGRWPNTTSDDSSVWNELRYVRSSALELLVNSQLLDRSRTQKLTVDISGRIHYEMAEGLITAGYAKSAENYLRKCDELARGIVEIKQDHWSNHYKVSLFKWKLSAWKAVDNDRAVPGLITLLDDMFRSNVSIDISLIMNDVVESIGWRMTEMHGAPPARIRDKANSIELVDSQQAKNLSALILNSTDMSKLGAQLLNDVFVRGMDNVKSAESKGMQFYKLAEFASKMHNINAQINRSKAVEYAQHVISNIIKSLENGGMCLFLFDDY